MSAVSRVKGYWGASWGDAMFIKSTADCLQALPGLIGADYNVRGDGRTSFAEHLGQRDSG